MKKLLVLTLCTAVAGLASAGSIQWNISLGRSGFIADSEGNKMNGTLYFLFTETANSLADAVELDKFAETLDSVKLGSMELTNGKNSDVNTVTKDNNVLTPGTEYSFSLLVFDTVNKQYYVSTAKQQLAYNESAEVVTANQVTFDQTTVGNTFAASWKSSVPAAVPEPSTALLGLLGVGMLIRRRRRA